jgi:hypothetical protein
MRLLTVLNRFLAIKMNKLGPLRLPPCATWKQQKALKKNHLQSRHPKITSSCVNQLPLLTCPCVTHFVIGMHVMSPLLRIHSVAGVVCGGVVAAFSYADSPPDQ